MKGPMEGVQNIDDDIFTNPYKPVEDTIEKKKRNLEKRKIKLQQYEEDERNGKKLSEEQMEARSRIGEVETQLEFVKDIMKTLNFLRKEFIRASKQREEAIKKMQIENDRKRLADFMTIQTILKTLTKKQVKKAFANGSHGAIMLCNEEHAMLENLTDCFSPSTDLCKSFAEFDRKCEECAQRVYAVIAATKDKVIGKTSGSNVRAFMDKIMSCKYVQEMKINNLPMKKEREEAKPVVAEPDSEAELPKSDPKVVFVRSECAASAPSVEEDAAEATSTEFGFEGYVAQTEVAVRDPPPPIPLPSETHNKESPASINGIGYSADGSNSEVAWVPSTDNEAKAETTSGEKRLEAGDATQGAEQSTANANRAERKPRGYRTGGRSRNIVGKGDGNEQQWHARDNEHPKQERESERPRPPRDSERQRTRDGENATQQREPRDPDRQRSAREERYPREVREGYNGQVRPSFRGGRGGFLRGGVGGNFSGHSTQRGAQRTYPSSANGYANGYGNQGYGAYSYASANPPRQAGFNFAPGPLRTSGDTRK